MHNQKSKSAPAELVDLLLGQPLPEETLNQLLLKYFDVSSELGLVLQLFAVDIFLQPSLANLP